MAIVANATTFDLKHGGVGGSSYATIPGVKRFDPGNVTSEQIDATDFDSTGNFREFVNGYKEAGEGSILLNFDPDNTIHKALQDAVGGAAQYFEGTYDNRTITLTALVTQFSTPVEIGGLLEATVTIKMTGAPLWEDAA